MSGEQTSQTGKWWPSDRKSKELDEALEGEKEFRKWLEDNLDKRDLKVISGERSPKEILDSLDNQTCEQLVEIVEPYYAADMIAQAGRAQSTLRVKRTKGVRKVTTSFMRFSKSFQEFLVIYSGIVDIMKQASGQYGGVAYGVLSTLFSIAARKQGMETAIQGAIDDMKNRLEEMAIYKRVYPEASLGALIAKVFKGIINFSRSAIKYYKRHWIWRLRAALTPSPFDEDVAEVGRLVAAVQSKCDALLADRCQRLEDKSNETLKRSENLQLELSRVKEQNVTLQETINKLKEQLSLQGQELSGMRETEDSKHLTKLLQHLGTSHISEDEHHEGINKCRMCLQRFAEDSLRTKMDLNILRSKKEYYDWIDSSQSCLLALSGRTEQDFIEVSEGCCWLSPAALDLIDDLRGKGQFVTYNLCLLHPAQREDPTARDIMVSFVRQILTKSPKVLREPSNFTRLCNQVPDPNEEEIDGIRDFLISILDLLDHDGPIYLILDRIDRSNGAEAELIRALLQIVKKAKCTLKIFVTSGDGWDITQHSKELGIRKRDEEMFVKLVWDQKLLDYDY